MTGALAGALRPDWVAPVGALCSTRAGGVSAPPFDRLNLGVAVGDAPAAVAENRRRFAAAAGARPVWLRQVHGTRVLRLTHDGADCAAEEPADAAWTDAPGLACTVQVADCLPVLLALQDGRAVAAAHAGWRGLAGGVIEATVDALCRGSGAAPGEVVAWLGPCIGPSAFEVGDEVRAAFLEVNPDADTDADAAFVACRRADGSAAWRADLPRLARARLARCGVPAASVSGGGWCTVGDASRFFSYRRDRVCGRMAAAVWRRGGDGG